jgi:ketosteroid isomerase-like protein
MTPAETKREMVRRMLAKDLPATMELIADDAVYFWSNGSAMFGKPAIEAAMKANFDSLVGDTYAVDDVTWVAETDDVAACVFRFRWTAVVDGRPVAGGGRGASVLKRVGGQWRVVHENLSQGHWKPR